MNDLLTPIHIIFYLFAAMAVISAVAVISLRNPVNSVLALVVTFFSMAGIWMMLHAEFLSLILLLVYVGAVMTLFLFVVMMLHVDTEYKNTGFVKYLPFGMVIVLLTVAFLFVGVGPRYFGLAEMPPPPSLPADYSNTAQLGALLYTEFAYPFEIAGVLLLTAIIAAITLAHRAPYKRRSQKVNDQLNVSPADRVRLVKTLNPKRGISQ